jgi:hypothetical protein
MPKFKFDAGDNNDDGLLEELGGLEDSDEELEEKEVKVEKVEEKLEEIPEVEDVNYYNDKIKKELEVYRQMKKISMMQQQTADGNLQKVFENF